MRIIENNMIGESKIGKKRKFSIMLLGIIAIVVLIVANYFIWRNYPDKLAQADTLKTQVELVEEQISQVVTSPSDLESKLEIAKNELTKALQVFPANVDKNDVVDFILTTAEECQVELVPLTAEGAGVGTYYELRYSATVTGMLSKVSNFMTKLHNSKYPTMVITDCSVLRIGIPDATITLNDFDVTLNFNVTLYVSSIKGR